MDKHCAVFTLAFKEEKQKSSRGDRTSKRADQRLNCLNTNPKIHPSKQDWFFHRLEGRARVKPNPNKQNKVFPDKIKGFFTFPLSIKKKEPMETRSQPSWVFLAAL